MRVLQDATGAHDLSQVVSITPHNQPRGAPALARLWFRGGGGVTTATSFDSAVKFWSAPDSASVSEQTGGPAA